MDVASVAVTPGASPGLISQPGQPGQQSPASSARIDQNDQAAKSRAAKTEQAAWQAAAKDAQAAAEQVKAPEPPPKPVVNTSGQTIGSHINLTA